VEQQCQYGQTLGFQYREIRLTRAQTFPQLASVMDQKGQDYAALLKSVLEKKVDEPRAGSISVFNLGI
jgi:hypothetical protein